MKERFPCWRLKKPFVIELENAFGKSDPALIQLQSEDQIIQILADSDDTRCALVRTTSLRPDWKRIKIDGQFSPWDSRYNPDRDLLLVPSGFDQQESRLDLSKTTTLLS